MRALQKVLRLNATVCPKLSVRFSSHGPLPLVLALSYLPFEFARLNSASPVLPKIVCALPALNLAMLKYRGRKRSAMPGFRQNSDCVDRFLKTSPLRVFAS